MKKILALLCVCGIAFAAFTTHAATVEYPAGNPLFKFELPDGWTTSTDAKGNLDVKANDKSDFDFSIVPAAVGSEEDLKAFLSDLAKSMGKQMKDFEANEVKEIATETGMNVMILPAKGKAGQAEMIITLAAFAPVKGKYFVIMSIAEKSIDAAHDKAMGEIVNSIKAVE